MSDPKLVPNKFSSYDLSAEQAIEGSKLTTLQMMVIQNQISNLAITRTNLDVDMSDPIGFAQEEAELKGQMTALQFLLDASVAAIESLLIVDVTEDQQP